MAHSQMIQTSREDLCRKQDQEKDRLKPLHKIQIFPRKVKQQLTHHFEIIHQHCEYVTEFGATNPGGLKFVSHDFLKY